MTGLLDRLAELREAATPGEWDEYAVGSEGYGVFGTRGDRRHRITLVGHGAWDDDKADAILIVAAVNALPTLLRIARAAEQVCDDGRYALPHAAHDDYARELEESIATLRSALASLGDTPADALERSL